MIRSACTAFVVFGLLFLTPTTALAQLGGEYGPAIRGAAIGGVAPYGINDGTGWVFGTVTDDDGDGVIKLPLVPIPGRLAVGVTHDGGVHGRDIWDFMSNGVQQTSIPLFINAQTGAKVGINFGELMIPPPIPFSPGQQFTVANGFLPEWPGIRLVDESNVPDLETFVQVVDTLPGFTGQVVVSNTMVDFTLVPEPGSLWLLVIGLVTLITSSRRRILATRST
jgi:hypothetical protein